MPRKQDVGFEYWIQTFLVTYLILAFSILKEVKQAKKTSKQKTSIRNSWKTK